MNYNRIGGDIDETRAYKHILSIGYEIETGQLVKLTELSINYKNLIMCVFSLQDFYF